MPVFKGEDVDFDRVEMNLRQHIGLASVPVVKDGAVVDYRIEYADDYVGQHLEYGKKYATL